MADLDSISCPACGSNALKQADDGTLVCQHCQSRFAPKKGKLVKGWWQEDQNFKTLTATGECPICGKIKPADQSFRCKKCKRPFICLDHQDARSFLCAECEREAELVRAEEARVMAEQLSAAKLTASKARRKRTWINCGVAVAVIVAFFLIMAISDAIRSQDFSSDYWSSSDSDQSANASFNDGSGDPASLLEDPDFASCVPWFSVGQGNAEQYLCVYGIAASLVGNEAYSSSNTYIHFSDRTDDMSPDFRVASFEHYFPDLTTGDCVAVFGTVRSYGINSFVYIDPASEKYPGEIYYWSGPDFCQ
jgi:hypothetical protein